MTDWTNPKTWEFDELVDENELNTHLRDNLLHLKERLGSVLNVVSRRGGSSTNWSTGGTTNYSLADVNIKILVGSVSVPTGLGGGFYSGTAVASFSESFTYVPLTFATLATSPGLGHITLYTAPSTSQVAVSVMCTNNVGTVTAYWLAIGE